MNSKLNEILLNRKNLVSVNLTMDSVSGAIYPTDDKASTIEKYLLAATASKNLESLGFRYSHNLISKLKESSVEEILDVESQILDNIEKRLGADVEYKPMYPGFPETVMSKSDMELYLDAMIYAESGFKEMPLEYTLFKKDQEENVINISKEVAKLKSLNVGDEKDIKNIVSNLMASSVAFSQNDKDDLVTVAKEMKEFKDFIPEKIPNKENLTWLACSYMQVIVKGKNPFLNKMNSPTDVLRLIVARNEGNTSLTENVRFKTLGQHESRMYAYQLAKTNNTESDISQRPEVFKRIFKQYHFPTFYNDKVVNHYLSEKEKAKMISISEKLYKDDLAPTFESMRNRMAKEGDFRGVVDLYKKAPGKLAKDMDWIISLVDKGSSEKETELYRSKKKENIDHLCSVLKKVVDKIDPNNLLKMQALINLRTAEKDFCVYASKKGLGNPYMKKEKRGPISIDIVSRINEIVDKALTAKYADKRPLGKVYIEDSLKDIKIPSAQRTDSKGAQTLPYGSQIDIEKETKNIRSFIWWTNDDRNHVDIDLSATFFDKNWTKLADVSYYDLRGSGYGVHSGDIRDGGSPSGKGASEFVDMDLENLKKLNVGYVVFSVNNFSNYEFSKTPCKFGWMELNDKSKTLYDPRKVKSSIRLNTDSTRSIPVTFDVENQKMIWMDRNPRAFCDFRIKAESSKIGGNNVDTYATPIMVEAYKAVNLPAPSLYHLMQLHIGARGEMVEKPEEAETIFSLNRINDEKEYPNMNNNICAYDNDIILGDLLPTTLSVKDIEYFKELEKLEKAALESEEKIESKEEVLI